MTGGPTTTITAADHEVARAPRRAGFGGLWASSAASNLADGVLFAGLPVLATTVTTSPLLISGVMLAIVLPTTLAALPSGVASDRLDRRRVLIGGNAARAVSILAVLAVVAGSDLRLAAIYLVAAIVGSTEMLVDTAAQTAVPTLVPAGRLEAANAKLGGTQVVLNDAIGAPLGSLLATMGAIALFGAPAALYVLAAVVLVGVRWPRRDGHADLGPDRAGGPDRAARPLLADVREGARFVADHVVLRRLAVTAAVANLGNTAFGAVLVLFVLGPLGQPREAFGWFLAALAVGGVLGSLLAPVVLRRFGQAACVRAGFVVEAAAYLAFGTTTSVAVAVAAAIALGVAMLVINTGSRTLRQTVVPDALLGRVTSVISLGALIATPIGAVLGGVLAEVVDLRAVTALTVGAQVAGLVLLRPVTAEAIAAARAAAREAAGRPVTAPEPDEVPPGSRC